MMRLRYPAALLLPVFALVLANCSDDSPTSPDVPSGDEVLADAVVGAAGDTLTSALISVELPAGALARDYDLQLLREHEPTVVGETETYRLEGLPADFSESVTVRLSLPDAEPSGKNDTSAALYVEIAGVVAEGDTSRYFAALPAVVDEAGLSAALTPGEYLVSGSQKDVDDIILDLILTGVRTTARSHVDIPLPIYITGDARQIPYHQELLLGWLIEDAERFMPLSEGFRQTRYPSQDTYMPMVEAALHFSHYDYTRIEGSLQRSEPDGGAVVPYLHVVYNPEANADLEKLRRQLHFRFWWMVYEARTALPVDWWLYATLYALESDLDVEPAAFMTPYCTRVLRGIARVMAEEDDPWTMGLAPYGYGMQHLARWIDAHEGEGWGREALGATVNQRAGYGYEDVGHLADALPGDATDWWPAFLSAMLTGRTGPIDLAGLLDLVEDTWVVDGSQGLAHGFVGEQYLLDGNLYRIDLEQEDFAAEASLRLTVDDPDDRTELVVFSVGDGLVVPIGHGRTVEVEHLDRLAALDDDLLVLTANAAVEGEPRTSRTITVNAMLDEGLGIPDVTTFTEISIEVTTDNTYTNGNTYMNEHLHITADVSWQGDGLSIYSEGSFSSGSDTVMVHIDPATLTLGDWYASSVNQPNSFETRMVRLAGTSVPVSEWGVDDWGTEFIRWVVYGEDEACSRLQTVHFANWYDDVLHMALTEYGCHESDAIYDTSAIHILAIRRTQ